MRTLRLQTPPLSGSDISAWQQFLTAQGVFRGAVDGVYGPASVQGTRDYQTSRGLDADGVVGPGTYAQAVRDGFAGAGAATTTAGMDASVNCGPFAACIVTAGMQFVARYYSQSSSKAITRTEALALSRAGLKLAAVYQDVNNDIQYFGAALGRQCALRALAQASAVGQPAGSAIYFAADFDPTPAQVSGPLTDHFRAVSQTFSAAATQYAVGVYGSGLTCRTVREAGLAAFTWLSGSTGFRESASFRPEANLVQIAPDRKICGGQLAIDDDIAQTRDFGAFQVS
jgi:peptidoglycan hydrolase-like protein with peptidoglycan-binding domain